MTTPEDEAVEAVAAKVLAMLPAHKASLTIDHNMHKAVYEPVARYLAEFRDEIDPDAYRRMVETDEVWGCQWYPDTPVGFYRLHAPTLAELLTALAKAKAND